MRRSLHEILEEANSAKTKDQKIAVLRHYDHAALRMMLAILLDARVEFDLPKGPPPYKQTEALDQEDMLYGEMRRMYLFLKQPNPVFPWSAAAASMAPDQRQRLFVQLLEHLPKGDVGLLLAAKDKKNPYKTITAKLVTEAFPNMGEIQTTKK